jgi:3-methyladenine DNA glycosylase AlkD
MHPLHEEILAAIKTNSGKPTKHTFLETYLGNAHPRYAIANPELRMIAKEWTKEHKLLPQKEFIAVLDSLFEGASYNEKLIGGFLVHYARGSHKEIGPQHFESWLDHLEGWAEIDTLCTGDFSKTEIAGNWNKWKPFLKKLARSKDIGKRRASLAIFCSVFSRVTDADVADTALGNIDLVKHEKEILITKAISWVLRSMIRHHRKTVAEYLEENANTLPAIAVRETRMKLSTGKKG